jgi:uncharacterized membrane protein
MKQHRLLAQLPLLIIFMAFLLRVYGFDSNMSFSTDEVTTITNSMHVLNEIPKLESRTPLQALWVRFGALGLGLGYSEGAVYILSVIAGVLTVALVYRLGKQIFNSHVGLLCSFMLAFSAYHIYWSRSARYYSLMVLLSSAAFYYLYQALIEDRQRAWIGYVLFRTLSLYDQLTALFILAGEFVFGFVYLTFPALKNYWMHRHGIRNLDTLVRLWQEKKTGLRYRDIQRRLVSSRFLWLAVSMVLILLAYAPVLYALIRDIYLGSSVLRMGGLSTEQLDPRNPLVGQLRPILGGGWLGPFLVLHLLDAWNTPLHLLMMVAFAGGLLFCALRRQWAQLLFILTITITPFVITANARSYEVVLDGRYLISLLPLYYMMVARGIDGLGHQIAKVCGNRGVYAPQLVMVIFTFVYAGLSFTKISWLRTLDRTS